MLRVVTLSTLFPNPAQPNFGVFVENQTLRLAACEDIDLRVVNPIPMPLPPLDRLPHYAKLRRLPAEDVWKGVTVARPRMRVIPRLSGPLNPALLVRAARPVLQRWRDEGFRFDVLDAQFFFPDGPAARVLAAEFGVPFSVKARGADIHYWGNRPGCRTQVRRAAADARGMLAVAASLRRDMIGMGMDGERIAVHYTGVDLERFRPQDRAAAKQRIGVDGPLVISLGALIPRKGHDIVIAAVAAIPGATLLVAGDGPDHAKLEAQARALGVADRVRLLGSVPHAELPALLAAADVMALASASEGLANAWIEAMACGTPVVAPEVDGAAEALDRPAAGRLLQSRTPEAFTAAIRDILADPPSQAAVRESAERFNWRNNTEQLHRHLHKLAGRAAA